MGEDGLPITTLTTVCLEIKPRDSHRVIDLAELTMDDVLDKFVENAQSDQQRMYVSTNRNEKEPARLLEIAVTLNESQSRHDQQRNKRPPAAIPRPQSEG